MSLTFAPPDGPTVAPYLALEFAVARPYRDFVWGDGAAAREVQQQLFAAGACEYAPPGAWVALEQNAVVGMYAALDGTELRKRRLREGMMAMRLSGGAGDAGHSARVRLAGSVMKTVEADEWYLSRIAVEPGARDGAWGARCCSG